MLVGQPAILLSVEAMHDQVLPINFWRRTHESREVNPFRMRVRKLNKLNNEGSLRINLLVISSF